jgi:hypothetical protein
VVRPSSVTVSGPATPGRKLLTLVMSAPSSTPPPPHPLPRDVCPDSLVAIKLSYSSFAGKVNGGGKEVRRQNQGTALGLGGGVHRSGLGPKESGWAMYL